MDDLLKWLSAEAEYWRDRDDTRMYQTNKVVRAIWHWQQTGELPEGHELGTTPGSSVAGPPGGESQ